MNWTDVVHQLGPRLYRYFSCSFVPSVAEESVQEVLVRLVKKVSVGGFDPGRGTLTMLAFGIAHHVRLETLKTLAKHQRLADSTGFYGNSLDGKSEPEAERRDSADALRKALSVLSEDERQVVLLHIDEDFTLAQIARVLGMPLGTVKSHVHRAKEKLRAVLSPIQ